MSIPASKAERPPDQVIIDPCLPDVFANGFAIVRDGDVTRLLFTIDRPVMQGAADEPARCVASIVIPHRMENTIVASLADRHRGCRRML